MYKFLLSLTIVIQKCSKFKATVLSIAPMASNNCLPVFQLLLYKLPFMRHIGF